MDKNEDRHLVFAVSVCVILAYVAYFVVLHIYGNPK